MGLREFIFGTLLVLFYNVLLVIALVEAYAHIPCGWASFFAAPMVALGVYADIKVILFIKNKRTDLWKK